MNIALAMGLSDVFLDYLRNTYNSYGKRVPRLEFGMGDDIGGKMGSAKIKMRPLQLSLSQKRDVRTQFGALCYRIQKDKVQVLLITSRGTARWIIPKGWPMGGMSPTDAAMMEAWEEAGVVGKVMGNSLGIYSYVKEDDGQRLPCVVAVFPVKVRQLKDEYPEAAQRRRKWFTLKKAAPKLEGPELRQIVSSFDPRHLSR